jgi:hypothetical protein
MSADLNAVGILAVALLSLGAHEVWFPGGRGRDAARRLELRPRTP